MNLSKKLVNKISEEYNLGKTKKITLMGGGNISHNFIFETNKGAYVVRVLGYSLTDYWKRQKELEFKVLEFLIRNKFGYDVPHFIKNRDGEYISNLSNKLIEAYPKLEGKTIDKPNEENVKEMAKALALYHKTIAKMKVKKKFLKNESYIWLANELLDMKSIEPKTALDKYMKKHVDKFIEVLDKRLKYKLKKDVVACHQDFHTSNLLFFGNKVSGILDFENISYGPRINDFFFDPYHLDYSILFIEEYKKYNKIPKAEITHFVDNKLLGNCHAFRWAYRGKMKNAKKRLDMLKYMVKKYEKYLEFEDLLKRTIK